MTQRLPEPVRKLAHALAELPGIGPRQATRLAIFLAAQDGAVRGDILKNLEGLQGIKLCTDCYLMHQNSGELCGICADLGRNPETLLIIEKETDLLSLENTGKFHGKYFIIGPIPKVGVLADWQKERLGHLVDIIKQKYGGSVKEIILGFNPTAIGDFSASLIQKELSGLTKKVSRLGRGLPTGGEIEFADDETLGSALEGRG